MIEKNHKEHKNTLICDDCGDDFEPYHMGNFREMIAAAREKGWRVLQEHGEWCHYYPDCDPG